MKFLMVFVCSAMFCAISTDAARRDPTVETILREPVSDSILKSSKVQRKRRLSKKMTRKAVSGQTAKIRKKKRTAQSQSDCRTNGAEQTALTGVQNGGQNVSPSTSTAKGAGTFDGDLRQLPPTKPVRQERPKLREPNIKPRIYVRDKKIKPE